MFKYHFVQIKNAKHLFVISVIFLIYLSTYHFYDSDELFQMICFIPIIQQMRVFESLLGFKQKKTPVLEQRNSILKLLLYINIPNLVLLYLFNSIVTEPYMDQYFHYNQFAAYNRNQFAHWDPKITTPPGLYILQRLFSIFLPADLGMMRAINCLFFSNIFVVYVLKIYDFLEPSPGNLTRSLNLALTPTIYFFNFMDYTDAASISVIAAMFYYNLTKSEWRLGLVSLLAVFIRQNNVIWILYLIIYRVLGDNKKVVLAPKSLPSHLLAIIKIFLSNKWQILSQAKFQIIAIGIFGAYTSYFNEGRLVFGDHLNHQMKLHPNQLLYLSLFCIVNLPITLGEYISSIGNFFQRIYISRHALAAYLFLLSLSIILVDQCTLIHPFIRDDNRHYTFYIYRYLLKPTIPKFLLCFLYAFSFHFIFKQVVNSELKLMRFILWVGACFGYLCLGELVEFRYFAIPFLMLCFELENKNFNLDVQGVHKQQNRYTPREKMIWTILIKVLANLIVIAIFLFGEFDNEYGKGRLMW